MGTTNDSIFNAKGLAMKLVLGIRTFCDPAQRTDTIGSAE